MRQVTVLIFHPPAGPQAGRYERRLAAARGRLAQAHRAGFQAAGATSIRIISDPPAVQPFGSRLAEALVDVPAGGLVILGSGAIALATHADRTAFVAAARGGAQALTNNKYSADVLAIGDARWLEDLPADFGADNAMPRWLAEHVGIKVDDLARRARLGVDLDSPIDLILLGRRAARIDRSESGDAAVVERLDRIRQVLANPRAEIVLAGRTSAGTIRWLERQARCRVRAIVEERGLRASARLRDDDRQRPPRSVLGMVLDRDGPAALGARLAELGDAAIIDSRVLLAHRLGPDESSWPSAEARFASDMLDPGSIEDPWLASLTWSALAAQIPVVLGGHTLVGPGARLLIST